MLQGGEHESGTPVEVQARSTGVVINDMGTLKFQAPDNHKTLTNVRLEDINGKQENVTLDGSTGVVELPADFKAKEGDKITFFYTKTFTGSKFTIDAAKYGDALEITYKTLCYDVNSESVYSELYWVFPSCSPTGNLDLSMAAGEALIPSMSFTVKAGDGTELGYKYEDIRPEFA